MPARTLFSQRLWHGIGLAMALLPYGLVAADDHLLSFDDLDEIVATDLSEWLVDDQAMHFGSSGAVANDAKIFSLPEPMVFDLVRPLGARRGEWEVNVLGVVPLNTSIGGTEELPDPLGLVQRSRDTGGIEWAPEIEFAVADGFAVEFELPFEEGRLEAYKGAVQYTFGTAFNDTFIHGTQVILQYDISPDLWTPTFLYLLGIQINKNWNLVGMVGFRTEFHNQNFPRRTETLLNLSLFREIADDFILGVETNLARTMDGQGTFLIIPQVHWEISEQWMVQSGVGMQFTDDFRLPEGGFRVIRTF